MKKAFVLLVLAGIIGYGLYAGGQLDGLIAQVQSATG